MLYSPVLFQRELVYPKYYVPSLGILSDDVLLCNTIVEQVLSSHGVSYYTYVTMPYFNVVRHISVFHFHFALYFDIMLFRILICSVVQQNVM